MDVAENINIHKEAQEGESFIAPGSTKTVPKGTKVTSPTRKQAGRGQNELSGK